MYLYFYLPNQWHCRAALQPVTIDSPPLPKIIDAIETAPEGSDIAALITEKAPEIERPYWHLGENETVLKTNVCNSCRGSRTS